MNLIDYSQWAAWMKCPHYWWERYINQYDRKYPTDRQRDDNLCIGSLVHDGLEGWYRNGRAEVRQETILEFNPTPEVVTLVKEILHGYTQHYPTVQWEVKQLEQPLMKELWPDNYLMAKVDQYFYVSEVLQIESGIPGEYLTLEPGYWIEEHKTKAQSIDRGKYFRKWTVDMQPDFQLIALKEELKKKGIDAPVNGVLVNVIEKPKEHIPQRTCKNKDCKVKLDMGAYLPHPEGASCPFCGHVQKLEPYKPKSEQKVGYYKLVVTRTEDELYGSEHDITGVLDRMNYMRRDCGGKSVEPPNRLSCVDTIFGDCTYYKVHKYGLDASEDDELERRDTSRYMDLFKIEEAA
jgi:hypothetical protein